MINVRTDDRSVIEIVGALLAIALAIVIVMQPVSISLLILGLASLAVLALITPLAALVAMLTLAPLRALVATESSLSLPLDIGQIAFVSVLGAWSLWAVSRHRRLLTFEASPVIIALSGYLLVLGITIFQAASIGAWLTEWLKWAVMLVAVLVVLSLGSRRWHWVAFGVITAAAGHALVGLYTFLGGSGADHLAINARFFRAFGAFGQPNPFGGFMGIVAPFALMLALGWALRTWHYRRMTPMLSPRLVFITGFYIAAAGLISLGVVISWSRGAWLAFGVALLVMLVALPRRWWQGLALLVVAGIVGGTVWTSGVVPATISQRIESATQELFTLSDVRAVDITPDNFAIVERLAHWQAALNMARAHPWLGVGIGNYDAAYETYRLINWDESLDHAHNYYLNVLAETGIIGLLAYLAMWLIILWLTWHARQHPDYLARFAMIGLLGSWTYLLVHSLTDNLYVNNVFIHLGFLLGLLAVHHRDIVSRVKVVAHS